MVCHRFLEGFLSGFCNTQVLSKTLDIFSLLGQLLIYHI